MGAAESYVEIWSTNVEDEKIADLSAIIQEPFWAKLPHNDLLFNIYAHAKGLMYLGKVDGVILFDDEDKCIIAFHIGGTKAYIIERDYSSIPYENLVSEACTIKFRVSGEFDETELTLKSWACLGDGFKRTTKKPLESEEARRLYRSLKKICDIPL